MAAVASIDLVLPVYNEQRALAQSVASVLRWLDDHPGEPRHDWRVVVADNASTDGTLAIARRLQEEHPGRVVALHVPAKGRGIALRVAWLTSPADVCAYMDVDLATDLAHLPELVDPIAVGEADIAYGTRLHARSQTRRGLRRELISRAYIAILRLVIGLRVSDAQCGFKAISRAAARQLLPLVRDTRWFFDSELLVVAQANGFRLREVPVRWTDDPDSRVAIVRTAIEDLRGIWRLRAGGVPLVPRA
ncbi:MAG: glycosyltransferase family 2 protein [Dehalococcoidia bacterium]|nr:glycosyltransferase family 2 protein [Dehalococcoidia bacterium]